MREICTSGSVRGGDGNIPAYSAGDLHGRSIPSVPALVQRDEAHIAVRLFALL